MAIAFWIIVGIVLIAIFAPGLLAVAGMWILVLALPLLSVIIKNLFSPRESSGDTSADSEIKTEESPKPNVIETKPASAGNPPGREVKVAHGAAPRQPVLREEGKKIELHGIDKCNISVSRFDASFECVLVRDRNNSYDANAIAVMDESGKRIAFVARETAAILAPKMDEGQTYSVTIVPGTYSSGSWGTCEALLRDGDPKAPTPSVGSEAPIPAGNSAVSSAPLGAGIAPAPVEHDSRLTSCPEGWSLRLSGTEWTRRPSNGHLEFVFPCSEPMARDLGINWVGKSIRLALHTAREFSKRIDAKLSRHGTAQPTMEIKFKTARLVPEPFQEGDVTWHCAMIEGLISVSIQDVELRPVHLPGTYKGLIFHMTAIDNLESILTHGILSKHLAEQRGLLKKDISDGEIQGHREVKSETVFRKPIHDYASFYFNPRNAMLFRVLKEMGSNVVILGVDRQACEGVDFVVSDRNAAASTANFGHTQAFLDQIKWNTVFSESWNMGDGERQKNVMQVMQSELLIPDVVVPRWISTIYCKDINAYLPVSSILGKLGLKNDMVQIDSSMFFGKERHLPLYNHNGYRHGNRYRR